MILIPAPYLFLFPIKQKKDCRNLSYGSLLFIRYDLCTESTNFLQFLHHCENENERS